MDFAQIFIFDAGWIFFSCWGLVLATLSVIAFKQDILPLDEPPQSKRRQFDTRHSVLGTRY
jgi:hypothetical protein